MLLYEMTFFVTKFLLLVAVKLVVIDLFIWVKCNGYLTGEWMVQVNRDQSQPASQEKKEEVEAMEEDVSEPKGDPEVAPVYIRQLLPVFTHVFTSTMLPSVRLDNSVYAVKLVLSGQLWGGGSPKMTS